MEERNRPDLEGNDEAANRAANHIPAGSPAAAPAMAADAGSGGGAELSAGEGDSAGDVGADGAGDVNAGAASGNAPYFNAGREFTKWFNSMLTRTPNPVLKLGTKTARVETLHDDGRLEVRIEGEGGRDEQQFVAFEARYLDMLLLKLASAARAAS